MKPQKPEEPRVERESAWTRVGKKKGEARPIKSEIDIIVELETGRKVRAGYVFQTLNTVTETGEETPVETQPSTDQSAESKTSDAGEGSSARKPVDSNQLKELWKALTF